MSKLRRNDGRNTSPGRGLHAPVSFLPGLCRIFPDRFARLRLLMWLSLVLLQFTTFFHRVSLNVAGTALALEFGLTAAALGHLSAAYSYTYVLMQIPGGALIDRFGTRRMGFVTAAGMGLGTVLFALAPTPFWVFTGRLLIGLGGATSLIIVLKFTSLWFRTSQFATMSGMAIFLGGFGTICATTPLALLVLQVGWRPAFLGVGAATLLLALVYPLLVRDRPAEAGFSPQEENRYRDPETVTAPDPAAPAFAESIRLTLKNRLLWAPFLVNLGVYGGFMAYAGTFGVPYLVQVYGLTVEQASVFVVLANLGFMVGAPISGIFSDRLAGFRVPVNIFIGLYTFFMSGLVFWPGGKPPLTALYLISFMLGFGAAGINVNFAHARKVSPAILTATATATINCGIFLGMAAMQPLFGWMLDRSWQGVLVGGVRWYPLFGYRSGFGLCLAGALLALIASFYIRERHG